MYKHEALFLWGTVSNICLPVLAGCGAAAPVAHLEASRANFGVQGSTKKSAETRLSEGCLSQSGAQ